MNTQGGDCALGKALAEYLGSLDTPVTIINELYSFSMGALFGQSKNNDFLRLCYPSTFFITHQGSATIRGTEKEVLNQINYLSESTEYWKESAMETAGLTKKELNKYYSEDYGFYGYTALDIGTKGWVDGLILKEFGDGTFLIKTRDGKKIIDVTKHRRSDLKNIPVIVEEVPVV
jgi:ATP-dependent protease ClpP protease subunit